MHLAEPRGTTWVQQIHWTIPVATGLIALFVGCLWYFGILYPSEALFAFIFMVIFAAPFLAASADFRERHQDDSEGKKAAWGLGITVFYTIRMGYWILYESPRLRWLWLALICAMWVGAVRQLMKWRREREEFRVR